MGGCITQHAAAKSPKSILRRNSIQDQSRSLSPSTSRLSPNSHLPINSNSYVSPSNYPGYVNSMTVPPQPFQFHP